MCNMNHRVAIIGFVYLMGPMVIHDWLMSCVEFNRWVAWDSCPHIIVRLHDRQAQPRLCLPIMCQHLLATVGAFELVIWHLPEPCPFHLPLHDSKHQFSVAWICCTNKIAVRLKRQKWHVRERVTPLENTNIIQQKLFHLEEYTCIIYFCQVNFTVQKLPKSELNRWFPWNSGQ